jgi:hypothetical protein
LIEGFTGKTGQLYKNFFLAGEGDSDTLTRSARALPASLILKINADASLEGPFAISPGSSDREKAISGTGII